MIRRIQALNYRCLRFVDVSLDRFHVLVGPNASGKSTLFDVVAFLSDLVSDGLDAAVEKRTRNFQDLVWGRCVPDGPTRGRGESLSCGGSENLRGFELAVEFEIPGKLKRQLPGDKKFQAFRYEISVGENERQVRIESERGLLTPRPKEGSGRRHSFPDPISPPGTILQGGRRHGSRTILSKSRGKDNFNIEVSDKSGKGWAVSISFGSRRSALGNMPESSETFPMATHVKQTLERRVKPLFLDSTRMSQASPPGARIDGFAPDGSNFPWAIKHLRENHRAEYESWLAHVKTVLTDLDEVRVMERPDDRHAYLLLRYETGVEVPSWMASDGTLRLLALTLIAYLPDEGNIYTLEGPENGIHPMAVDWIYQSLNSVYDSQLLLATHSPVVLKLSDPGEVLCFAKDAEGATDIVRGSDHPLLTDWKETSDNMEDLLFARGVFG